MKKIFQEMLAFSYLPALCIATATIGMLAAFTTETLGYGLALMYTVIALIACKRCRGNSDENANAQ